jgi:GAF domain-containing protein
VVPLFPVIDDREYFARIAGRGVFVKNADLTHARTAAGSRVTARTPWTLLALGALAILLLAANERERTLTVLHFSEEVNEEMRMRGSFPFGVGITGRAVERRTPMIVNDAHLDPRGVAFSDPPRPEALLVFPIVRGGAVVGCLDLWRNGDGLRFSETDLDQLRPYADRLAQVL